MPNAWDVGSAKILEALGFAAIATTSSGFGGSLGRMDQEVTLAEVLDHVAALVASVDVPLSVDTEYCYSDTLDGVVATVHQVAERGAAGLSIEDYHPDGGLYPIDVAAERVAAAADAARLHGMTLTARAENHFYGVDDLEDTIARLQAYHDAGAHVVYAPLLPDLDAVARVCREIGAPTNVLLRPDGPTVAELAAAGVRRVSTGGGLAFAAYGALASGARELLDTGTSTYLRGALSGKDRDAAFGR